MPDIVQELEKDRKTNVSSIATPLNPIQIWAFESFEYGPLNHSNMVQRHAADVSLIPFDVRPRNAHGRL